MPAEPSFFPNETVAGRYRIVRFLAQGAMGEVYEVEDRELQARIALKVLRPEIAADARTLDAFRREVDLARRVSHPNVCRTYDLGYQTIDGPDGAVDRITFLTMELLPGETLSERISKGPLSPDEALPLVTQMAAALDAAHAAGVVHRDFKTGNVILVPCGSAVRAVVTDFGLSLGSVSGGPSPGAPREFAGTPAFMSPEQVEGHPATPASDVYSFGVVVFELLTGHRPFVGETAMETATKRLKEDPPNPLRFVPGLPTSWAATILRCLSRRPSDRFPTAGAAARALVETPVPSRSRRRRRVLLASLAALFLAVAVAAGFVARNRTPAPRRSVAVLGFKNLSGREDAAWLSTALAELFGAELGAGDALRLIPGENVGRMRLELLLPESDSYAPDTLQRIRRNLGTDLVVVGSYLSLGREAGGKLRLDARVQETATGATLATVRGEGSDQDLFDLVAKTGEEVRISLGIGRLSPSGSTQVRASLPRSPEAARHYAEGLARLRGIEARAARELLESAVEDDPENPLIHMALAQAWSELGYDLKAREVARRAFDLSARLPWEERLRVESRYLQMASSWRKAIEIDRALLAVKPDSLDDALHLVRVLISAGRGREALTTLERLRKSDDPRIDLLEAEATALLGDFARSRSAASRASAKGELLGARLLAAQGRYWFGRALQDTDPRQAIGAYEDARSILSAAGERRGEANALARISECQLTLGELSDAREKALQALEIYRLIGDQRGIGATTLHLGCILQVRGELKEASTLYRNALERSRETGDRNLEAIALSNMGDVLWRLGSLDAARKRFEESQAILVETGNQMQLQVTILDLGEVENDRGNLEEARRRYEEALALARKLKDPRVVGDALLGLGKLARVADDLPAARKRILESVEARRRAGEKGWAAESLLDLAALALEEGRLDEAESVGGEALAHFEQHDIGFQVACAEATLALAELARGHAVEARKHVERAEARLRNNQQADVRLIVAVAGARVRAASGTPADVTEALRAIDAALAEATTFSLVHQQLAARLAKGQVGLLLPTSAASAKVELAALGRDADALGFALIARRAREGA